MLDTTRRILVWVHASTEEAGKFLRNFLFPIGKFLNPEVTELVIR